MTKARSLAVGAGVPFSLIASIVVLSILASTGPPSMDRTVVVALINLVFAVGLYIFVGNTGVFSFGHLSFAVIGAYTAGLLVMSETLKESLLPDLPGWLQSVELDPILAVLIAGAVAALAALVVAVPLSRISGLAAGLATVALLIVARNVASNWDSVTRGRASLSSIPTSTSRNSALVWVAVVIIAAWLYQRSRFGMKARATKSDEVAAAATGIGIPLQRGIPLVLSAAVTGIGGALFALFLGSVGPEVFYVDYTFLIITMVVVGGADSLSGAVVGSVVVSTLSEVLRRAEDGDVVGLFEVPKRSGVEQATLGALLVAILLFRPKGILGGRELSLQPFRRARPGRSDPVSPAPDPDGVADPAEGVDGSGGPSSPVITSS